MNITKTFRLYTEAAGTCELLTLSAEDDWLLQDALDAEMEKPGREECWVEDHNP